MRMKVKVVSQESPKLLDQLRAELRLRHYSIRTEEVYVDWSRRFILFHEKVAIPRVNFHWVFQGLGLGCL